MSLKRHRSYFKLRREKKMIPKFHKIPQLKLKPNSSGNRKEGRTIIRKRHRQSWRKRLQRIKFNRNFAVPGRKSSVSVSYNNLKRRLDFQYQGKFYKMTLRQILNILRDKKFKLKLKRNRTKIPRKYRKQKKG